jgi:pimeloyl-ACP methyl ester carboxylesterase
MSGRPFTVDVGEAALRGDPRFRLTWQTSTSRARRPLILAVHDSNRDYTATLDAFAGMAKAHDLALLAPLFPVGAGIPDFADGYKFLREPGIDYIAVMEAMLDQFSAIEPFDRSSIYLFGFSGGAQFALRFALFEARHLSGLLIAAPGSVTLLDDSVEWWPGLANAAQSIHRPLDLAALADIPVRLMIGDLDRGGVLVDRSGSDPNASPFANIAGLDRQARIKALHASFIASGIPAQLDILDGVGHEFAPIGGAAAQVIEQWLLANSLTTPASLTTREGMF